MGVDMESAEKPVGVGAEAGEKPAGAGGAVAPLQRAASWSRACRTRGGLQQIFFLLLGGCWKVGLVGL